MEQYLIYFSENTSLYLYSSFIQANAAIIAITGLFIVFKLQSYLASIDVLKLTIMNDRGMYSTPTDVEVFDRTILSEKKKKLEEIKSTAGGFFFSLLYQSWIEKLEKYYHLRERIILPTILLTLAIVINSILLLTSTNLHYYHKITEVLFGYIITLFQIVVWSYVSWIIVITVKEE